MITRYVIGIEHSFEEVFEKQSLNEREWDFNSAQFPSERIISNKISSHKPIKLLKAHKKKRPKKAINENVMVIT